MNPTLNKIFIVVRLALNSRRRAPTLWMTTMLMLSPSITPSSMSSSSPMHLKIPHFPIQSDSTFLAEDFVDCFLLIPMLKCKLLWLKVAHVRDLRCGIKENIGDVFHENIMWIHHDLPYWSRLWNIHTHQSQWNSPCWIGVRIGHSCTCEKVHHEEQHPNASSSLNVPIDEPSRKNIGMRNTCMVVQSHLAKLGILHLTYLHSWHKLKHCATQIQNAPPHYLSYNTQANPRTLCNPSSLNLWQETTWPVDGLTSHLKQKFWLSCSILVDY